MLGALCSLLLGCGGGRVAYDGADHGGDDGGPGSDSGPPGFSSCDWDGDGSRGIGPDPFWNPHDCGGDDCNDIDSTVHPGATDLAGDGVDSDCDGADGVDLDRDGFAGQGSGGDDCDDSNPNVHPGMVDGPGWRVEVVGAGDSYFPSLAYDDAGAHLGYYQRNADDVEEIWYATNAGGPWSTERVASHGQPPSIAVAEDGQVRMAWERSDESGVMYAVRSGDEWEVELVDVHCVWNLTLRVDPDGVSHLLYGCDTDWVHATNRGGDWEYETVGGSKRHSDVAFAVDDAGTAHIAYENDDYALAYATNAGGVWTEEVVDEGGIEGGGIAIARGADGSIHLSYRAFFADLYVASRREGVWEVSSLREWWDCGSQSSIAVDASGAVHVAYRDGSRYDVRYATDAGGDLASEVLADDAATGSLAIDPVGVVHVALGGSGVRLASQSLPDGIDDDCDGEAW